MQQLVTLRRENSICLPSEVGDGVNPARILAKVFETLDQANIKYCVLHGYEDFSSSVKSDVDCLIDANVSARELLHLLHKNRDGIGAQVVHCRGHYIVLASRTSTGSHCFLRLDFAADCDLHNVRYFDGSEIIATRRRHGAFWVPAQDLEFVAYLVRTIDRGQVNEERAARLSSIYRQDPQGCAKQLTRFWAPDNVELITEAARTGDWRSVRRQMPSIKDQLRLTGIRRRPVRYVANLLAFWSDRAARFCRPDGLSVVFLGPDGAGKSSTITALACRLTPVFPRHACWGFAPGIINVFRKADRTTDTPHALKPRSFAVSLLRLAYWLIYHTYSYFALRLELARSTLLLHDRSFVDILVDQKRYRYGGPMWMLRLVWRLAPKPDLVILLDAAPEVLQRRKQEVPFEVTARQRKAYLTLVRTMSNGRVIDAAAQPAHVADSATEAVLEQLRSRVASRHRFA